VGTAGGDDLAWVAGPRPLKVRKGTAFVLAVLDHEVVALAGPGVDGGPDLLWAEGLRPAIQQRFLGDAWIGFGSVMSDSPSLDSI
jgi:hypothetical protein